MRASACKECLVEYSRNRYKTHADDYKANAKKQRKKERKRNREFILDFKRKNPCEKCGEPHLACLDFHHPNDDKEHSICTMSKKAYGLKALQREINKCQVLCSNCHRKLHWKHLG